MLFHAITLSLLAVPSTQGTAPQFRAVVLEETDSPADEVHDINARGEAVGFIISSAGHRTATYWDATAAMTLLGRAQTPIDSEALAISAWGIAVGHGGSLAQPVPILWTLSVGARQIPGPRPARAVDVNARGEILLDVHDQLGGLLLKRDGSSARIFDGTGCGVRGSSELGHVAGDAYGTGLVPFRWTEAGGFQHLPAPMGASIALSEGISPDGSFVAGWALFGLDRRAVVWDASGQVQVLPQSSVQTTDARANAVNSSGWVVGRRYGTLAGGLPRAWGTLWAGGVAHELDDLIQAGPSAEVLEATGINDRGQIVGSAEVNGLPCLIRLDPL
jgi:uncharacterized membrane protein